MLSNPNMEKESNEIGSDMKEITDADDRITRQQDGR